MLTISVSDLFLRVVCYALVALTAWEAGRGWLRHRDRYRTDILWVVGLLIIILLLGGLALPLAASPSIVGVLFRLIFLFQPYFLLRLVHRFRSVPDALTWAAAALAVVGATVPWVVPAMPSGGWAPFVSVYFVVQLSYAAWAFGSESSRAGGVTGSRLWFAAAGTWLHVTIAAVLGLESFLPGVAASGPELRRILGLGVFACYYIGLVAPRQVRALWAQRQMYQSVRASADRPRDERASEAASDLVRAVGQGVSSVGRAVLLFENGEDVLTVRATNPSGWTSTKIRPGAGLVGRCLARGTPVTGAPSDFETEVAAWSVYLGRSVCAVPIMSGGHRWGAVVIAQRFGSLFPDDDLEFVTMLASHAGVALEHGRLAAAERAHLAVVAERRLQDREQSFHAILDSILDYAVIVVNDAGEVVEWKAGADGIFGGVLDDVRGRPAAPLFGRTTAEFSRLLTRAREEGYVLDEGICRQRDGAEFLGHTSIRPVGPGTTGLSGFVLVTRDETERRALNERLQQAQKMEALGQLAGGVAHDFNTLLTAVLGYAATIEAHPGFDRALNTPLAEIRKTAARATALTRRLLAFSRQQIVAPQPVDLPQVVAGMVSMLEGLLGERVSLTSVTDAADGWMLADPVLVEQVVLNLVVNARDATPDGGTVEVRTGVTTVEADTRLGDSLLDGGTYVTLTVTDSGVGMEPEVQKRIFEPFFTTKEPGRGTGLGLSVVYGIVKQIGGGIAVDSAPGRGSTFRVFFRASDDYDVTSGAPLRTRGTMAAKTILVVDDEQPIRGLMTSWLASTGYRVLSAEHSAAAISIMQGRADVSLVVADVVMPGGDGPALVDALQRASPGLKALFVSGHGPAVLTAERGLPHTAEFLAKPFRREAFLSRVREILATDESAALSVIRR